MELKIVLNKTKNKIEKLRATPIWKKIFVHKIDEKKNA